ncbi:MAG: hypothetical protein ACOX6T_26055 [Myxococcales bacterium]|jgi:hypothetical protein
MNLALALLLSASVASAAIDCGAPSEPACLESHARRLLAQGEARPAIALLKQERALVAASRELTLLLARAYLAEKNEFWALRTLSAFEKAHPGDCEALSWIALTQMGQGALDDARASLARAQCPESGPLRLRRHLLEALVAVTAGDPAAAREPYAAALAQPLAFPEDARLAEHLAPIVKPSYEPPVSGRLEAQAGYTSNALAGSPTDASGSDEGVPSPMAQLLAQLRLGLPSFAFARPAIEGELRGLGYSDAAGRDFSYLLASASPGLSFGDGRVSAAYRFEALLIAGGDRYDEGPLWFSNAHRGELEVSLPARMLAFGGAGRRVFREAGRSRWEADLGVGGNWRLSSKAGLTAALTARRHSAMKPAYDAWGGSALLSADWRLPGGASLRLGLLASGDTYPDSAGYFDPEEARRELLLKGSASGWLPVATGARAGLTYEYSRRVSTAQAYEFDDHRVLLKLAWSFDYDPSLPGETSRPGHVELDYGLEAREAVQESVREMLRQDEAMQRSSSCIER